MARKTYAEKLRDPRWQKMRLKILERDGFTCRTCGDTETTLHVHHRRYIRGRQPWEYEPHLLVTLCEACHEEIDEMMATAMDNIQSIIADHLLPTEIYNLGHLIKHSAEDIIAFLNERDEANGPDECTHPLTLAAGEHEGLPVRRCIRCDWWAVVEPAREAGESRKES